nr:hypothetical protein [uncultured Massilia sp.]
MLIGPNDFMCVDMAVSTLLREHVHHDVQAVRAYGWRRWTAHAALARIGTRPDYTTRKKAARRMQESLNVAMQNANVLPNLMTQKGLDWRGIRRAEARQTSTKGEVDQAVALSSLIGPSSRWCSTC